MAMKRLANTRRNTARSTSKGLPRGAGRLYQIDPPAPGAGYWDLRNIPLNQPIGAVLVRGDLTERWATKAALGTASSFKMVGVSTAMTETTFVATYTPAAGYTLFGAPRSPFPGMAGVSGAPSFAAQDAMTTGKTMKDGFWTVTDGGGATVAWVHVVGGNQYWIRVTGFVLTGTYTFTWAADPYGGDPHAFETARMMAGYARFYIRGFVG